MLSVMYITTLGYLSIMMGYRLDIQCFICGRGKRFFSSQQHSDYHWGLPRLVQWILGLFPWVEVARL
jgi:hypothetical protein